MNMSHSDRIPRGDGTSSRPSSPHGEAWPPAAKAAFEQLAQELAQLRADMREMIEAGSSPTPKRELLTVKETADMLRMSKRSVETMIGTGELSVMDVGPNSGLRLVHRDNIDAYLRSSVRQ